MSKYPDVDAHGRSRTPYAVNCYGDDDIAFRGHGLVYLTNEEYKQQMSNPNRTWMCPLCGFGETYWDDENFEEHLNELGQMEGVGNG